ncbi:MAG: DegV family protein [Lachnospiraceae bacterium]|nr:DegV family protein [Lachnospiraceae bacterium]
MIRILVDSSADYTPEELQAKNMELVPITITIGEDSYQDGVTITRDTFYDILTTSSEFPKTAQPSPQDFLDFFEDAKEKDDTIIYLCLSSGLSGTFQSATLAKNMAEYNNIYLIDTLSATLGIRVLAEYACKLRDENVEAVAIVEALENLKSRITILAAVDTLEYLYKGGRLNKATAAIGELANLKPLITVTNEGKIGIVGKCLGRNKAFVTLTKMICEKEMDTNFPCYSVYTLGTDNSDKFEEKLAKERISITERLQIGATIGAHVGPGAYGVVFVSR